MVIETERLRLRPFKIEDAEWFFKVTYDDEVREYLPGAYTRTLKEAESFIKEYFICGDFIHDFYFIIEDKQTHKRLGFLDIVQGLHEELGVAMFVAKEYRRNGYIVEAVKAFAAHLPGRVLKFCVARKNKSSLIATQKLENIVETTSPCLEGVTEEFRFFSLQT